MSKQINEFLQKQMTRKEFLRHIGLLLLSVFGVANLLKYLGQDNFAAQPVKGPGYGSSAYGGEKTNKLKA